MSDDQSTHCVLDPTEEQFHMLVESVENRSATYAGRRAKAATATRGYAFAKMDQPFMPKLF